MTIKVFSVRDRPDLIESMWQLSDSWPTFMLHDIAAPILRELVDQHYADHSLIITSGEPHEEVIGRAFSVPIKWTQISDVWELPAGWSDVIILALMDVSMQRLPNLLCALEITLEPSWRGRGLSYEVLEALKANGRKLGYSTLLAPVRPTMKSKYIESSMAEYLQRQNSAGLSIDPWLRVHQRTAGTVLGVAAQSMTIVGSLADWRIWTGQAFDRTGLVLVDGALSPVFCDATNEVATYIEPNVWVRHDL